jgi:serine/threonine protein kinase
MKTFTSRLLTLLQRYEELAEAGQAPDPAEFCADDPDLLAAFTEALGQIEQFRLRYQPDSRAASTTATDEPPAPLSETLPSLPGYEVVGHLGAGGMGVVYRAIQLRSRRTVALKMLRVVDARSPALARFQTEVEAVARLQHPHIVQVFEIGEAAGLPFFSMEFCAGGSLQQRLGKEPLAPGAAVDLVRTLALAIQVAHEAQIIHRDLKPANVLLSADGTPKVTDFGLAKKLDEQGQTHTGDVMGTPSYMAPEQAAGQKNIGPACDIYALGAILYECLTGRPPFRAATPIETVLQVLRNEPVAVRQLNPSIPRDLETIVHKCLQKDPARRYLTARDLAEDLARFQTGHPIQARPVGVVERSIRWCRRNPALAATLLAAVVFLVGGSALASWFAVEASRQAHQAGLDKDAAQKAQLATENANTKLVSTVEELEVALAQTNVSPLSSQATPLLDAEINALEGMSRWRDQPVAERVVREVVRNPRWAPRLGGRAEFIWQAALGLDIRQRAGAERLLLTELRSPQRSKEDRENLALAAALLGDLTTETTATVTPLLSQALSGSHPPDQTERLGLGLSLLVAATPAREATLLLTGVLSQTPQPETCPALLHAFTETVGRLNNQEAASVCSETSATLNQTLRTTSRAATVRVLAGALATVAARLERARAIELVHPTARVIGQGIGRGWTAKDLEMITQGLLALAPYMDPSDGHQLLARALTRIYEPFDPTNLIRGLDIVLDRTSPEDLPQRTNQAASVLTQALASTTQPTSVSYLTLGIQTVTRHMNRHDADQVWQLAATRLATLATQSQNLVLPGFAATSLVTVAENMSPASAAATIAQAMQTPMNPLTLRSLTEALATAVARMEPQEAEALVTQTLSRTRDPGVTGLLVGALATVALRLEPKEAIVFLNRIRKTPTTPFFQRPLFRSLAAVASWQEPHEAAATLTETLRQTQDPVAQGYLAQALARVALHLEPAEAVQVCGPVAATLDQALNRTNDAAGMRTMVLGLAAVVDPLGSREATERCAPVAARLVQELGKATPNRVPSLAQDLVVVAAKLESEAKRKVCNEAADILIQAFSKSSQLAPVWPLAEALPVIVSPLESRDAARKCRQAMVPLLQALNNDPAAWQTGGATLGAIAASLEPREAAPLLLQFLGKTRNPKVVPALTRHLYAVLSRESTHPTWPLLLAVSGTAAGGSNPTTLFTAPVLLEPACELPPPPLPAQFLVDLLRHPLCAGDSRRLVLDQLSRHYGRPFVSQWDFVRYAEEHSLGLDLQGPAGAAP